MMKKEGKRWSKDQKLKILKEASTQGVRETLEKYGVYPATYYSWKKKYEQMGESGFAQGMTKERLARIKELEQEVERKRSSNPILSILLRCLTFVVKDKV